MNKRIGEDNHDKSKDIKRFKPDNGSSMNTQPMMNKEQIQALLEAKKKEIAARLSRMNNTNSNTIQTSSSTSSLPPSIDIKQKLEEARERALRAKNPALASSTTMAMTKNTASILITGTATAGSSNAFPSGPSSSTKSSSLHIQSSNETASTTSSTGGVPTTTPTNTDNLRKPSHGELHPALLALQQDPSLPSSALTGLVPRFATTRANQRLVENKLKKLAKKEEEERRLQLELEQQATVAMLHDFKSNPYFDTSLRTKAAVAPKERRGRKLKFAEQGKFIEEANKLREKERLERLKQQIAATAMKTGIETELELAAEEGIRKEPPPPIEWWDAQLLPNNTYDDFEEGIVVLDGENEIVTNLVQHPVPIDAPGQTQDPEPLPLMLTKRERKKLRRHRRAETRKEKQDKIRMGLLPPEQPKMRISNLMRVLGTEAVQDPTQMEKVVRQQMAARQAAAKKHDDAKRLTEDEKKEKKRDKLKEDTSGGVHVAVFKIKDFSNYQYRNKVNVNAQQYNLTGVAIFYSNMNLLVVEGGPKGIKAFKKLMLRRINWNLKNKKRNGDDEEEDESNQHGLNGSAAVGTANLRNTSDCALVWEGMLQEPTFKFFKLRTMPTEQMAKEFLDKFGVVHYWDTAKHFSVDE